MKSKGEIKIGNDADFSIVDLNKEFTITNEWIARASIFFGVMLMPVGIAIQMFLGKIEAKSD